jgi:hypothetical protein
LLEVTRIASVPTTMASQTVEPGKTLDGQKVTTTVPRLRDSSATYSIP